MNDSMETRLRLGAVHFMLFPATLRGEGPILETVERLLRDPDLDLIELTWVKDAAVRRQVRRRLEACRLACAYAAQPRLLTTGLNPNHLKAVERRKAEATLKEGLEEAAELGAESFAFLSGAWQEARRDDHFSALLETTREICRHGKRVGMSRIALEVFDFDVDKKALIGPTDLALRFAEEVRRDFPDFGLLVDLSHIPICHESIEGSVGALAPVLAHVHVGNAVPGTAGMDAGSQPAGYGDQHPRFGFPGGANDVAELARFLRALEVGGYLAPGKRPVVSFEVKPFGEEDPADLWIHSKRTLKQAWAAA